MCRGRVQRWLPSVSMHQHQIGSFVFLLSTSPRLVPLKISSFICILTLYLGKIQWNASTEHHKVPLYTYQQGNRLFSSSQRPNMQVAVSGLLQIRNYTNKESFLLWAVILLKLAISDFSWMILASRKVRKFNNSTPSRLHCQWDRMNCIFNLRMSFLSNWKIFQTFSCSMYIIVRVKCQLLSANLRRARYHIKHNSLRHEHLREVYQRVKLHSWLFWMLPVPTPWQKAWRVA